MSIRKALEELYKEVPPPEGVEERVLRKIERYRLSSKLSFWKKLALVEGIAASFLLAFLLFTQIKPVEYETMSAGKEVEVRVQINEDISLLELSEELSKRGLRIEGPYNTNIYFLIGDPEEIDNFLKGNTAFKKL